MIWLDQLTMFFFDSQKRISREIHSIFGILSVINQTLSTMSWWFFSSYYWFFFWLNKSKTFKIWQLEYRKYCQFLQLKFVDNIEYVTSNFALLLINCFKLSNLKHFHTRLTCFKLWCDLSEVPHFFRRRTVAVYLTEEIIQCPIKFNWIVFSIKVFFFASPNISYVNLLRYWYWYGAASIEIENIWFDLNKWMEACWITVFYAVHEVRVRMRVCVNGYEYHSNFFSFNWSENVLKYALIRFHRSNVWAQFICFTCLEWSMHETRAR